jgi:hypothetical protein
MAQTGLRQPGSDGAEVPLDRPVTRGMLPLDDCLYALQATVPHLNRSSPASMPQAVGISRLPEIAGGKTSKKPFKRYHTVELPRELMAGTVAKAIRLVLSHFGPTGGCNKARIA